MSLKAICCAECGNEFQPKREHAEFCSPACRSAFNNRANLRGRQIYDLFRAMRRERAKAKELNIWTEMCRLELQWQIEDERERPGRRSYMPPRQALASLYDRGALRRGEVLVSSMDQKPSGKYIGWSGPQK